jgi:hypothetical protein
MNSDGSEAHRVVHVPGGIEQGVAWSPDGKRLLYQRICQVELPIPCTNVAYVRTLATRTNRRVSVDGVRWTLARWRSNMITYVTQP